MYLTYFLTVIYFNRVILEINMKLYIKFLILLALVAPSLSLAMNKDEGDFSNEERETYRGVRQIQPPPYRGRRQIQPYSQPVTFTNEEFNAIPRHYPLFTFNFFGNISPESCWVDDFAEKCSLDNSGCTSRKGVCGETHSTSFFEAIAPNWTTLKGSYKGNSGFDGFYKVDSQHVKFVVVEDKTGTATLNRKTKQMSLGWQYKRAEKISKKHQEFDFKEFHDALLRGQVVNLFTYTYTIDDPSVVNEFHTDVYLLGSPTWSSDFKTKYISNYKSIHSSTL